MAQTLGGHYSHVILNRPRGGGGQRFETMEVVATTTRRMVVVMAMATSYNNNIAKVDITQVVGLLLSSPIIPILGTIASPTVTSQSKSNPINHPRVSVSQHSLPSRPSSISPSLL